MSAKPVKVDSGYQILYQAMRHTHRTQIMKNQLWVMGVVVKQCLNSVKILLLDKFSNYLQFFMIKLSLWSLCLGSVKLVWAPILQKINSLPEKQVTPDMLTHHK